MWEHSSTILLESRLSRIAAGAARRRRVALATAADGMSIGIR
jgi:hypothetical protein